MRVRYQPRMAAEDKPSGNGGVAVLEAVPASPAVAVPPTTPSAQAVKPAGGGLAKLSFGKLVEKKESRTTYPVFPDGNGEAAIIAARIVERTAACEALNGALETDKAELKQRVSVYYFTCNQGRVEVLSSVAVASPKGEVLVVYQNRYSQLPDESGLLPILGERTAAFFRQAFELKVTGDKLPQDRAQSLLDELQTLFGKYNCLDALEVKAGVKPVKDFHERRHVELTPAENFMLDQVCPIVAMVKTKGRK